MVSSLELDQDLDIDCLCIGLSSTTPQTLYYPPNLTSISNTTFPTITLGPSGGVSIFSNSSNFTLSNFMASLSSNGRIGPQPTNITGIEAQNSYGRTTVSRDSTLLLVPVLFQIIFRVLV